MQKNKYLEYFSQSHHNYNDQNFSNCQDKQKKNKKNQSSYLNHKKDSKPLPHISQQYQYKITNQLLLFKIMNPKRDKLIVQSFSKSCSRPDSKKRGHLKSNSSLHRPATRQKQIKTFEQEILPAPGSLTPQEKLKNSILMRTKIPTNIKNSKSYEKQFNIILQNQRMGKRIINTKSSVQEALKKTFYTYKSQCKQNINLKQSSLKNNNNSHYSNHSSIQKNSSFKIHNKNTINNGYSYPSKINSGVRVFFNNVSDDQNTNNQFRKGHVSENQSYCTERKQQKQIQEREKLKNNFKPNSLTMYQQSKQSNNKIIQYPSNFDQAKSILISSIPRYISKTSQQKKRLAKQSFQNSRIFASLHNDSIQHSTTNCDLQFQTHFPQSFKLFGHGPTILMIYNLQIKCNPKLKDDSLLLFQLITHQRRINLFKTKQKTIRTTPICYDYLRCENEDLSSCNLNCLKFCINVSQIGDFVPLRVYKINGVELQQLGIIDIDLSPYKYRKMELDDGNECLNSQNQKNQQLNEIPQHYKQEQEDAYSYENKPNSFNKKVHKEHDKSYKFSDKNILKQIRYNQENQCLQRQVLYGKIHSKLRKRRLAQVQIQATMLYKVYSKKFKNIGSSNKQ